MTIRWIESQERSGNQVREKLGEEVPPKGILYTTEQFHNDWPNHSVTVFAMDSNAVMLKGDMRRFCYSCTPRTLKGSAINTDSATGRQIRWTAAGAIESPKSSTPSGIRKTLTFLFRR